MYKIRVEYQTIGVRGTKVVGFCNVSQLRVTKYGVSFYVDNELITINNVLKIVIDRIPQ